MEELFGALSQAGSLTLQQITLRILVAVLFGVCVALIYRVGHGRHHENATMFTTTLLLLAVLISIVSMVIGDSVARAFGLVGALSIVRFRTVVDDTRDTAFVMFSVIVGMAAGTGLFVAPLVGIPIVGTISLLLNASKKVRQDEITVELEVRQGLGEALTARVEEVISKYSKTRRILRTTTSRQGSTLDIVYLIALQKDADLPRLVGELNRTEGVQSVDGRLSKKEK